MSNQETRGIAIALPFLQYFELRIGSWGTKKGRMRIRRDSLGLKFFLSFFLSKEFTFASQWQKREKKGLLSRRHEMASRDRQAAIDENMKKKNRLVNACLESNHVPEARRTIALTHQLHLVTNALVTNRRLWRRFVVNQSVNCVSAFSRFPWWQGHFSEPTIYHPRATIHSSLAQYTPALGAGHTCPIDVSLFGFDTRLKCAERIVERLFFVFSFLPFFLPSFSNFPNFPLLRRPIFGSINIFDL